MQHFQSQALDKISSLSSDLTDSMRNVMCCMKSIVWFSMDSYVVPYKRAKVLDQYYYSLLFCVEGRGYLLDNNIFINIGN